MDVECIGMVGVGVSTVGVDVGTVGIEEKSLE